MNPLRRAILKARSAFRRQRNKWISRKLPHGDPTKQPLFAIGIYTGASPLRLKPAKGITNPVLTACDVTDVSADFVADPFIIRNGEQWHMFFEIMNRDTQKGQIALADSADGYRWKYRKVVLEEPFHLSYPYVFAWEGNHYMIPETFETGAVRLYKALDFPVEWTFVKTLVEGEPFVDASPFFLRDHWWLFAGTGPVEKWHSSELRLFHSESLTGPWIEHPQSPMITNDMHSTRPAGRMQLIDGKLFRLAQDCEPLYGLSVSAFEVTRLTEEHYQERRFGRKPVLKPDGSGWNSVGMHHIDAHRMQDGRWLACVDGWTWGDKTH